MNRNPMFNVMDRVTNTVAPTYTYLKDFRSEDMSKLNFERLSSLNIPDRLEFLGAKLVNKKFGSNALNSFSHNHQIEFVWKLYDHENDVWILDSFICNFPALHQGLYFLMNGTKYFLMLILASTKNIHSKDKVILKHHEDMLILNLDGIPSFNISGKRVPMALLVIYKYLLDGKSLEALLGDIFSKHSIVEKDDSRLKMTKHLVFKDFCVLLSPFPSKVERVWIKSFTKMVNISSTEFTDIEKIAARIKNIYGSPTSKKGQAILDENMLVIQGVGTEKLIEEVNINVKGLYNHTQLENTPLFADIIVNELYKVLKQNRKTYTSSYNQSFDKLQQIFNKGLLRNIIPAALFNNKLLQFDDTTNNFDMSLKVSLSHASGRAVNSKTREVTDDYKGLLSLHYSATGKRVGLTSYLTPT